MCKNEIKKGSTVILKCNIGCFLGYQIPEGTKGFVLENAVSPFIEFDINPNKGLHDGGGLGEDGKCWSVHINYLKLYEYKTSNRYKLKQAIKETGFSSRKLSHFASGNESFFYNQTGLARFKEYGDISWSKLDELIDLVDMAKERLNAKIMQDAFDEREKLDLGAKTVDENNVPVKKFKPEDVKITFGDTEIKGTLSEFDELFSKAEKDIDNSEQEDIKRFVDQLQSQAIEKRDSRLKNWLIVLIGFSLLLAFYFFQK